MYLLVDIGNSRLKWGVCDENRLEFGSPLNYRASDFDALLFSLWRALPKIPQRMAISCVGSKAVLNRVRNMALSLWPSLAVVLVQSESAAHGVVNGYEHPEKLGVDRWLCLVAARRMWPTSVCIADCGTAITLDLLDANGCHQGGLICPGLTLMKQSLSKGTADLDFSEQSGALRIARNTEEAIFSGTLYAAIGLIKAVLMEQEQDIKLILTGGDADLIARHIDYQASVVPDLVLKGLSFVLSD